MVNSWKLQCIFFTFAAIEDRLAEDNEHLLLVAGGEDRTSHIHPPELVAMGKIVAQMEL